MIVFGWNKLLEHQREKGKLSDAWAASFSISTESFIIPAYIALHFYTQPTKFLAIL